MTQLISALNFIAKWDTGGPAHDLNERQGAQTYFNDLCAMLGVPPPGTGGDCIGDYIFEKNTLALGQHRGYADVFKRGAFAWENKAPGGNLDAALRQLLGYSHALDNPPLLVVCDRLRIRIHTQFTGHPSEKFDIALTQLTDPAVQQKLRCVWTDPESFRPKKTTRDITEEAAKSFATLADNLRKRGPQTSPAQEHYAEQIAHFLTQTLFCFFAEDVGLLPGEMFKRLVNAKLDIQTRVHKLPSERLTESLSALFNTMDSGGAFGLHDVPWFNGGLFKRVNVPKLEITDITELRSAATLNWSAIDVSIFGTLFERGLDPGKRSQLGAHYTDPATIQRIIDPVIRRPLLQKWELLAHTLKRLLAKSTKKGDAAYKKAHAPYIKFLDGLADFKILDPACGSGNFLYLGLKALKDIEHHIVTEAEKLGLERPVDLCTSPANMLGIEINEYAAELARVTVWIGELQWRIEHGYPSKQNPVLDTLDYIEHRDALITWVDAPSPLESDKETSANGVRSEFRTTTTTETQKAKRNSDLTPFADVSAASAAPEAKKRIAVEAEWPQVSVVIGNPPFLGGNKKRGELGDDYFEALRTVYAGRVPGGADLVTYWFDKARKNIVEQGLGAAGFVATQSIRAGSNRTVLQAIVRDTRIFDAWADETWVNEGAAVRVSLVAFGWGECCFLNGQRVSGITADLSTNSEADMSHAGVLAENAGVAFQGPVKVGAFDIEGKLARHWLTQPNVNGQSNAVVLRPWANGQDLTKRPSDTWIVDFGDHMPLSEAILFEAPFQQVEKFVKPMREKGARQRRKDTWWLHGETVPTLRKRLEDQLRYIATPRVAKHRFFVTLPVQVWPDSRLYAIARADDTTFGILSSRIHEVWSLATASMHGVGNDPTYNAKSCFETFPFPAGLTPADTAHQRTELLDGGACIPAGLSAQQLITAFLPPLKLNTAAASVYIAQAATKNIANSTNSASVHSAASAIAVAAKRLADLRDAWLNPPEWTQRQPEVTPLGMQTSPYPDRVLPKPGLSEADTAALGKRTLTNLYNQRQAGQAQWLASQHAALDQAVATAYGWADYTAAMPDEEILSRLLALNLARSQAGQPANDQAASKPD